MDVEKSEFPVEIEGVAQGVYALEVGGSEKGDFEVFEDDGKFRGKLKFSAPPQGGNAGAGFRSLW